MTDPNADRDKIVKEKSDLQANIINIQGILGRQISTGLWKEATPAFQKKLKDRQSCENELS